MYTVLLQTQADSKRAFEQNLGHMLLYRAEIYVNYCCQYFLCAVRVRKRKLSRISYNLVCVVITYPKEKKNEKWFF